MSGIPRDYPGVPCGSDASVVGAIGTASIDLNRADYFAHAWLRTISASEQDLGSGSSSTYRATQFEKPTAETHCACPPADEAHA